MRILYIFLLFGFTLRVNGQWSLDSAVVSKGLVSNESGINSKHLESCPVQYGDYILMVKSNDDGPKDEQGEYYFDLVYAAKNAKGQLSRQAFLPFSVNSNKHEGQAAYDALTEKLYFTRAWFDEERGTHKDTIALKIYEARASNQYANPQVLPFCSDKYNVCHPALSTNGNMMIFASNMPGSSAMDLYKVEKSGKTWGSPVKFTSAINGLGNEVFPYLYRDSILFFSSDRKANSGGFDIYYSILNDSVWSEAAPLPFPVNSSFDDIGFLLNDKMNEAYFSSNRPGGKGKDDIYRLNMNAPMFVKSEIIPEAMISCELSVIDKLSFLPVEGARIVINEIMLDDSKNNQLQWIGNGEKGEIVMKIEPEILNTDERFSDADGMLKIKLNQKSKYLIHSYKMGYQDETVLYQPGKDGTENTIVLSPLPETEEKSEKEEISGNMPSKAAVGSVFVFNNILYDYNSSSLKNEAIKDLNIIYQAMTDRPDMRIQLSAHTDSRGNALYNKQLSEQRAMAAKKYLVEKGIRADRINTIGFGESRLINRCSDGVNCSEQEHLVNRRTEVLILE